MRLEVVRVPDPLHGRRRNALRLAIVRQLQCVSPAGLERNVALTIWATFSGPICGLGPRPGLTAANPPDPSSTNRSRVAITVERLRPLPRAISEFDRPSAASKITHARRARPCGVASAATHRSNVTRSLSKSSIGAAASDLTTS